MGLAGESPDAREAINAALKIEGWNYSQSALRQELVLLYSKYANVSLF